MSSINTRQTKTRNVKAEQELTVNKEGAPAFILNPRQKLIESVLGAFWNEDLFYSKGKENSQNLRDAVKAVAAIEPKFVLQVAAYARQTMYMRTTPQVILVEAANLPETKPFVREYAPKI